MLSRKIIYFVLIIISVFFYILFVEKLSFYLMIFILALPLALLGIILSAKFGVSCRLSAASDTAVKNSECQFRLKITNKTIFPYPSAVIKINYRNKLSDTDETMKISFPIHPRTSQTLVFSLSSGLCGVLNTKIKYLKIYDYIKLFSCRVKSCEQADICIIPDNMVTLSTDSFCFTEAEDSSIFSESKSGDDPSEIFDLKEYIPGDKMNRIHWNLSSKQNQLITKHYSLGIDSPAAVIADITFDLSQTNLQKIDIALELFYGISYALIENQINHDLYIKGNTDTVLISDYSLLNESYLNLINSKADSNNGNDIILNLAASKSKIFLVTNKPYENYDIPEIPMSSEMKCFFTGSIQNSTNITENLTITHIDSKNLKNMPEGILFNI